MRVSGFYENETAKKQMNDLNLFDFFKSKNIIRIKDNHIYFDPFFLSSIDENGNSCGYGNCTLSFSKLRLNYPEINEILENNKQNYVLDKLAAAGIEVVSDKAEFDRILERENILQKMAGTLSEEEQRRYFTFDEKDTNNFKKQIDNWQNNNINIAKLVTVGKIPPI